MAAYKSLRILAIAILVVSSLVNFTSIPKAKAETISVIPPKFELFGNPGDVITEKLRVRNDSDREVTYQTASEDFTASGDQGEINLIEDPDAPRTNFSLTKWLTVEPSRFSVPAKQEKVINITIRIPKNGEPGGHYAAIQVRLAGQPTMGSGSGASVESRLNSLILLRVSGNLEEKLKLESFKSEDPFYQNGPVNFILRTKNEGNVHLAPNGTITITNTFNRKVKEIPLRLANVLPNSSRSIKTAWEDKNMVGRYTATLVASYGQNKAPLTSSTTFYVIPLSLVWITLGVIILIIFLITKRKRIKKILHSLTSD